MTGLCGANCRHSYFPFFPGISQKKYTEEDLANIDPPPIEYEGKTYTHYEANQKQRAMERAIRRTKREIAAADGFGDTDMFHAKSIYLKGQRAKYKDFSNKAGLRVKNERLQELRFDRKVSNKVTVTAERHHKDWLKSIGAENSSLNTLDKYYKGKYTNSDEYTKLITRNKELKLLKSKHPDYTQEQISKCITLYNESENNGFIASSHFMEQFIKRV